MSKVKNPTLNPNAASTVKLPLLPLKDIVVFPHMIVPVFVSEELCINAVDEALLVDRKIFLSAFKILDTQPDSDQLEATLPPPFDVYNVGTVCTVMRTRKLSDGRIKVLVQGLYKAKALELSSEEPSPVVRVEKIEEAEFQNAAEQTEVEATIRSVRENLEKVVGLGKVLSPDILMVLEDVNEPGRLADMVAANLGLKVHEAQSILAIPSAIGRLQKVLQYLSREIEVYQMQMKIQGQAKDEINRMQKEHYLREQMRAIKGELGDSDKEDIEKFWKELKEKNIPEKATEEISRQIKRLERMHQDTSEATLTRTHIETTLSLPWGVSTTDNLHLKNVKKVLDEDHYGLQEVKDRIVEFLAVKKLNKNAKSPIICFFGPPGVGKTSLGKSIAASMNREFVRISLGGVKDEADIRGHRKTYVGAYPGRIVQAIKTAQSMNPIIMLDEIDKLAADQRGDPSSALLEVLDPEQNKSFTDHYLGVEFDLSQVMFIANANNLSTIPAPLRDRMEIIEISGYTEKEKNIIAKNYLIPKQVNEAGLGDANVDFKEEAVLKIISKYTRESGLRNLDKQIASVCRKIARNYAETCEEKESAVEGKAIPKSATAEESLINVDSRLVEKHLGSEKFMDEFYHHESVPGVALGLAYTNYGGEVLAIEVNLIKSKTSKLVLTGQLGDVMKESAQTAWGYIKSQYQRYGIDQAVIDTSEIHVHVPAGATPKDGPSAGTALATALISALTNKAPRAKSAMTGEITLHGKVLPIGGLKEKVLASQRAGMERVVLPLANKPQWLELSADARKDLEVHFVDKYESVFDILFDSFAVSDIVDRPELVVNKRVAS